MEWIGPLDQLDVKHPTLWRIDSLTRKFHFIKPTPPESQKLWISGYIIIHITITATFAFRQTALVWIVASDSSPMLVCIWFTHRSMSVDSCRSVFPWIPVVLFSGTGLEDSIVQDPINTININTQMHSLTSVWKWPFILSRCRHCS